jgi:hypothetical protein
VQWAFASPLRAASRAFPLELNVDALPLQVELRFDDLPRVLDAEKLGIRCRAYRAVVLVGTVAFHFGVREFFWK